MNQGWSIGWRFSKHKLPFDVWRALGRERYPPWLRHLRTHQHNRTSGVDQWDHQMNQMLHWNWLRVASWEAFCYAQIDTRINWNCTSVSRFRATLTNPIGLRMEFSSLPSVTWESNLIRSIFHLLCTNNFQIIAINTNSARDSTLKWTTK